ncbi:MAG: MFS transporter, partial [Algiphilus sp.]
MALLIAVYLTKFYVDVVALPAGVMALAIAAGRAFDAISDPLMGWLSDRTRSRFGRRMPYIAIGVLGNTAMFVLLLNPPEQLPDVGLAGWAVAALLLSFLFLTISAVPRQALAMELTQDQGHRQDLFAAIAGFVAIGTIVGAVMPNVLAGMGIEDGREQMFWQSMIYGGAYLAANIVFLLVIREPRIDAARGRTPLVPGAVVRDGVFAIASGSLLRARVLEVAGRMDERFFIDYVDVEFSLRLRRAGFEIVGVGDAVLQHRLGEVRTARLLGREKTLSTHEAWRRRLIHRNRVRVWRRHGTACLGWLAFDLA